MLGVTTVSSDAVARARLAAKLLHVAGGKWTRVPVYAGTSTPTQYMKQVDWAAGSRPRACTHRVAWISCGARSTHVPVK